MSLKTRSSADRRHSGGFTLAEVVIAVLMLGLVVGGLINGYIFSARRAEWSAKSLAAHSLAMQGIEQARAAKWDPGAWPAVDQLPPSNYTRVEILDLPNVGGNTEYATNFISITSISTNPLLREIRTDCVWLLPGRGSRLYTNTMITYRAPDQ